MLACCFELKLFAYFYFQEKVQIDGEILYALLKRVSPTAYLHLVSFAKLPFPHQSLNFFLRRILRSTSNKKFMCCS